MWPPRRSEARSESSRLTAEPVAAPPSEERRSVSCITSAWNWPSAIAVAVRQTPLTATESPSAISSASRVRTPSVTPSSLLSTTVTCPRSWTSPVNTLTTPCRRAEISRSSAIRSTSSASARVASAIRSTPSPSSGSRALEPPTTTGARNSRISSTSPASRNAPASLGPPSSRIDVTSAAPSWSSAERTRAGSFSPVATITSAPATSSASVCSRDAARPTTTVSGSSGRAAHELGVERQPPLGVEHDAARLARRAVDPGVQLRVVGQRGPDPDRDGVALGAPVMRAQPRRLAGDPLRVPGAGRDLAVERHRGLEEHVRAAGPGVLAERLVEQPRADRGLAVGDGHLHALVAQDAEPAAGGLLGRVVGGDHDAPDAGLEDRVGARRGAGPGGSTARARRRASRRAGRCRSRPAPRARRAPRRRRRGSPRRSPSRRARPPRRPWGWGSPARARARRARSPAGGRSRRFRGRSSWGLY